MARTLKITYGALIVGADSSNANIYLDGKHSLHVTNESAHVTFRVVISGTAIQAVAAEQHLTSELQKRDQRLTIISAGGTRYDYNPAAGTNSGFLAVGEATKPGLDADTEKSREYVCSVRVSLPESTAGLAGRRDGKIEVSEDGSGRRTLTATGGYTALVANGAVAQFEAAVDTWADAEAAALGVFKQVDRDYRYEDRDKLLTFALKYVEIINPRGDGAAAVRNQVISARRSDFGDGRSPQFADARPFRFIEINYFASIRSDVTTDLEALYESTLRNYILRQVSDNLVVLREEPLFHADANAIAVRILAHADKSGLVSSSVEEHRATTEGRLHLPRWTGNRFARRKYQGHGSDVATITVRTIATFGHPVDHARAIPPALLDATRWDRIAVSLGGKAIEVGGDNGSSVVLVATTSTFVFVRAEEDEGIAGVDDEAADPDAAEDDGGGFLTDTTRADFGGAAGPDKSQPFIFFSDGLDDQGPELGV